jgi:hypothetical protein
MGRGWGRGGGGGRGRGRGYGAYDPYSDGPAAFEIPAPVYMPRPSPEDERRYLEDCAKQLEQDLAEVKERLARLGEAKKE